MATIGEAGPERFLVDHEHRRKPMRKEHKILLIAAGLMAFVLLMIGLAIQQSGGSDPDPAEAFTTHLRALDEERYDDANALVDITCGRLEPDSVNVARADLEDAGFTFESAFLVREVWTNRDGSRAVITLDVPRTLPLPTSQGMALIDGEWLLYCGRD